MGIPELVLSFFAMLSDRRLGVSAGCPGLQIAVCPSPIRYLP